MVNWSSLSHFQPPKKKMKIFFLNFLFFYLGDSESKKVIKSRKFFSLRDLSGLNTTHCNSRLNAKLEWLIKKLLHLRVCDLLIFSNFLHFSTYKLNSHRCAEIFRTLTTPWACPNCLKMRFFSHFTRRKVFKFG